MRYAKQLSLGFYLLFTGINATLMGFVTVVAVAISVRGGEASLVFAMTWFFSLPLVALVSLATMATYSRYARLKTWKQTLPFFAGQSLAVAVLAWALTYVLIILEMLEPFYEALS